MPFVPGVVEDFIGRGIIFPIELANGRAIIRSGFELIRSSINSILGWPLGNRFFLSEFGSRLDELLEEPNDDVLFNLINTFVIDAVNEWEKRVELLSVGLERMNDHTLHITLYYKILNSQQTDTYIFPFYKNLSS